MTTLRFQGDKLMMEGAFEAGELKLKAAQELLSLLYATDMDDERRLIREINNEYSWAHYYYDLYRSPGGAEKYKLIAENSFHKICRHIEDLERKRGGRKWRHRLAGSTYFMLWELTGEERWAEKTKDVLHFCPLANHYTFDCESRLYLKDKVWEFERVIRRSKQK